MEAQPLYYINWVYKERSGKCSYFALVMSGEWFNSRSSNEAICCLVPYHHSRSLFLQCHPLPFPPPLPPPHQLPLHPLVLLPLTPFLLHLLTTRLPLFHLPQFHPPLLPTLRQLRHPPPHHRHPRLPVLNQELVVHLLEATRTRIPQLHRRRRRRQPQLQAPSIPAQCLLNHQPRSMKPRLRESLSLSPRLRSPTAICHPMVSYAMRRKSDRPVERGHPVGL